MKKILTDEELINAIGDDGPGPMHDARLIESMVLEKLKAQAFAMNILRMSTHEVLDRLFLE